MFSRLHKHRFKPHSAHRQNSCAPYRLTHLGGQSLLGDYVETVGAAEGDAEVGRCRTYSHRHRPAGMQPKACQSEFFSDGGLLHGMGLR